MSAMSAANVAGASVITIKRTAPTAAATRGRSLVTRKLNTLEALSYSETGVIRALSVREVEPDGAKTQLLDVEAQPGPDVAMVEPCVVVDHDVAERVEDRVGAANAQRAEVGEESKVEAPVGRHREAQFRLQQERLGAVKYLAVPPQLLIGENEQLARRYRAGGRADQGVEAERRVFQDREELRTVEGRHRIAELRAEPL